MNEAYIKASLLTLLRRTFAGRRKPVVSREFKLGVYPVRADMAVLAGDEFVGIEIKSDRDTLRRLPTQLDAYSRHFDRTMLVVARRHLKNIDKASLCGAALWSFDIAGELEEINASDYCAQVDVETYLQMMTQDERKRLIGSTVPDIRTAREAFFEAFRIRYGPTAAEFWASTARRRITHMDVKQLSRFAERRERLDQFAADKESFWERWGAQNAA